jgi:hypothetical protein
VARDHLHEVREALPARRTAEHLAASFHLRARYRRGPAVSRAALAGLLLVSCGRRDEVTEPITRVVAAVEKRDADEVARWLTQGYHDSEHADPAAVVARVKQLVFGYERLKITVSRLHVEDLGATRRARFRAELSGTPKNLPGLEGLLPRSSAWDFEVSLVNEGGRWLIATASWAPPS